MKKSLVAVGVIVALGVVWTGGAWFTGKQLEGRMAEMIDNANAEIKNSAPESGLVLSYQNYKRGLFHSTVQLVVKQAAGTKNAILTPEQSVLFNETIDHGPFPFAQLKKFNPIPSMASIHTELVNNDATKQLFVLTKDKPLINVETRVGYGGATSSDIVLAAIDANEGENKLSFSGGKFTADVDGAGNEISLSGEADSGLINTVNEYGQRVQFSFNGIKTDGDSKRSLFDQRVGSQKATVDKLSMVVDGKEIAVVEGFNLNAKSDVQDDKKHFTGQFDYSLDALKVQNQNMGSGKLTLKFGNIDAAALREFSQKYNAGVQQLMADPALQQNPELYQQKSIELISANLPLLLKGDPTITVAPLSWKNAKGESNLNLSLFLKDPQGVTGPARTPEEQLDRYVKSLDAKLVIPMPMATEMMSQVAQLEGYNAEESQKLASQQIKGLAAMGQMFRITKVDGDNITTSLQYGSGKAALNGEQMPLGDLFSMFALPAGMGGPALQDNDSDAVPQPGDEAPGDDSSPDAEPAPQQ
ncbi:Bacterial protein of uncharacterised function (DUF945) [Cedecea lapagei]|uniref:Bacterial protein of uncharacterized function (DUF945) n=1 Tax=Cedecea lapagei TaxID=158823 RepID=A0A447V362_9ENTR|nr:YdgA family protein [Cedecea lapagei]VEB98187.1 Bacterial protein of uncharacterised function (DUF945) [Cedecea lapagei]